MLPLSVVGVDRSFRRSDTSLSASAKPSAKCWAMTETAIREAVPADIPALHALIQSAYRGETSRAGWTTMVRIAVQRSVVESCPFS